MTTNKNGPNLAIGTMVKIRNSGYRNNGKIVEFCGNFGPGGAAIYRVRVRRKPRPAYIEVLEDQLEPIAANQ